MKVAKPFDPFIKSASRSHFRASETIKHVEHRKLHPEHFIKCRKKINKCRPVGSCHFLFYIKRL